MCQRFSNEIFLKNLNFQVQIPGLVQPISLQLSGGATNAQQTSLLVSVPVTSTGGVQTGNSGVSSAQTVVFTNTNAQTYATLPLGLYFL